jgi:hypothetical protein
MGFLRDAVHNRHMSDPVQGTALVANVNDWLLETRTPYTLRTTLVVEADGVPKTTVEHSETVNASTGTHLDKWPAQGDTIPVTIDRADPTRVQIEWDEMRGQSDKLRESAAAEGETRKQELLAQAYGSAGGKSGTGSEASGPVCELCQTVNPEGTHFCRDCGARLPSL